MSSGGKKQPPASGGGTTWGDIFSRKKAVEALTGGLIAVAGASALAGGFDASSIVTVGAPTAAGSLVSALVMKPVSSYSDIKDLAMHAAVAGGAGYAIVSFAGLGGGSIDMQSLMLMGVMGAGAVAGVYVADNYLAKYE